MDSSALRRGARFVGYVDLGFFTIGCCVAAPVLALAFWISKIIVEEHSNASPQAMYFSLLLLWLPMFLIAVMFGVGYFVSTMLLKATKVSAEPKIALLRGQLWRNWNLFVFASICMLYYTCKPNIGCFLILLILRGFMLVVVSVYIEQLG